MSLQNLAALAVRITGIILLIKAIEAILTVVLSGMSGTLFTPSGLPFLGIHGLWLAAAVVLIAAPLRIAGALGAAPDDAPAANQTSDAISAETVAQIIVIGTGLYFLVDAAKAFFSFVFYFIAYTAQGAGHGLAPIQFWQQSILNQTVMGAVSFVAALWFLFGSRGIAELVHRLRRA